MNLISKDYLQLNQELHKDNPSFGVSGQNYVDHVMGCIEKLRQVQKKGFPSVLDYGCGKSTLANNLGFKIQQYDPAIEAHSRLPAPADLVVCTDVLEHIEPDLIDNVLDHIASLSLKMVFLTIANGPAKKILKDGRNAHLIQQGPCYWVTKICHRWNLFEFVRIGRRLNNNLPFEEYLVTAYAKDFDEQLTKEQTK